MKVAVFEHPGKRKTRLMAYTIWYSASWDGCCMHDIPTNLGNTAKQKAIEEHRRVCMKGRA